MTENRFLAEMLSSQKKAIVWIAFRFPFASTGSSARDAISFSFYTTHYETLYHCVPDRGSLPLYLPFAPHVLIRRALSCCETNKGNDQPERQALPLIPFIPEAFSHPPRTQTPPPSSAVTGSHAPAGSAAGLPCSPAVPLPPLPRPGIHRSRQEALLPCRN